MEEYIVQIETFLRGQMTQREEIAFKESLVSNEDLRLLALSVVMVLRAFQKVR